jgi:hypothetical protein
MPDNWATDGYGSPLTAFIQWKGTDVCMDCLCVCGNGFHIHGEFAYSVKCPNCGKVLEVSAVVKLREVIGDFDGPTIEEYPCRN